MLIEGGVRRTRVIRWILMLAGGVLLSAVLATSAAGTAPSGPRLAIARFLIYPKAWSEIGTVGPQGQDAQRLAGGPDLDAPAPVTDTRPSWSSDGSRLAFLGGAGGRSPRIFVVHADGSGLRGLGSVFINSDPVFAPDGSEIAFQRLKVVSGEFMKRGGSEAPLDVRFGIWSVDPDDGSLRRLTPWQKRVWLVPSSYSPDGSSLAVTAYSRRRGLHALAVRLDGNGSTLLAHHAKEPVYSPDGSRVAFVRERRHEKQHGMVTKIRADLFTVRSDGSALKRLTHTRKKLERWPSWDPSGERIAFTRLPGSQRFPEEFLPGSALMQINADGSCLTKVLSSPGQFVYGAAWQPGPGREAGRIAC